MKTDDKKSWRERGRTAWLAVCAFALVSCAAPGLDGAAESPADLVLRGGHVHTMDAARTRAEAVAVANGRIVAVGSDAALAAYVGPDTEVVDLAGGTLLPGFHDSHVHPCIPSTAALRLSGAISRSWPVSRRFARSSSSARRSSPSPTRGFAAAAGTWPLSRPATPPKNCSTRSCRAAPPS